MAGESREANATSAVAMALNASASLTACVKVTSGNRPRNRATCASGTSQNATGQIVNMSTFMACE